MRGEFIGVWVFKHAAGLRLQYQDNLSALIHDPSFKQTAGEAVFSKARVINTLGNRTGVPASSLVKICRVGFNSGGANSSRFNWEDRVRRRSTGRYESTAVAGEVVRAFVPADLPPQPALDLGGL